MQYQPTNEQDGHQPLVSFIITYYELPASMLRECIDSILALALNAEEREIILVDDGSAITPLPSLADVAHQLTYIRQPNGGLSAARNTGLKMARGRYIQFVDADDMLVAGHYDHCLDIARFHQPDVVMFAFTTEQVKGLAYHDEEPTSGAEHMRKHNIRGSACGYLFRSNILGSLRFTPGIVHEDEEFTPLLLLRAETLRTTDAQAYYYRYRPQSITTAKGPRIQLRRLNDLKDIIGRLHHQAAMMPHNERLALQRRVAQLTMDYIYKVIVDTRSKSYLKHRLAELSRKGLFPLPDQDYTTKYKWFRRISSTDAGLDVLLRILPMMNRER
jgi:glycosyltransferase involved in cell wall biosynthesis